jgi:hypothetical protein
VSVLFVLIALFFVYEPYLRLFDDPAPSASVQEVPVEVTEAPAALPQDLQDGGA